MNRKAQGRIGKTLTWFAGFMIIVFTLILLVLASMVLSSSKRVTSGWDNIELERYGLKDLEMQNVLIVLLNKEVESGGKIKDLIIRFDSSSEKSEIRGEIGKEIGDFFSELNGSYILVIDSNGQDRGFSLEENVIRSSNLGVTNVGGNIESYKRELLEKGIVFPLILEDKNIKLKFYYVRDLTKIPHLNVELSLSILKTRGCLKPLLLGSGAPLFF